MAKKTSLLLLILIVILSSCVSSPTQEAEDAGNTVETPEEITEEVEEPTEESPELTEYELEMIEDFVIDEIPSYYKKGDIEYSGVVKHLESDLVVSEETQQEMIDAYTESKENWGSKTDTTWDTINGHMNFYTVGTIKVDPYKDYELVVSEIMCEGMCFQNDDLRFAWDRNTKELVYLPNNSSPSEYQVEHIKPLMENADESIDLKGLNPPEKISIPNTEFFLELDEADSGYRDETFQNVAFTDSEYGKMYDNERTGCLYLIAPDGSQNRYVYNPGFFEDDGDDVVWNKTGSSTSIAGEYNFPPTGCMGMRGGCYRIDEINGEELVHVAISSKGVDLYEAKAATYVEMEKSITYDTTINEILNQSYQNYSYRIEGEPQDFEGYLSTKPVLFWEDPLGRWGYLQDNDSQTLAECAKPVIYLYPEEETDVNVQVHISEFTETIPDYPEDGWTVHAYPDGEIYNYADEQTYPYLFWEGYSDESVSIDQGFIIEKEDAPEFLDESLDKLGLNSTEKADFLEFWEPKMMAHEEPYLFISFIGTNDFNQVAPLTIEPAPDTLIRIFMYYEPVWEKYSVKPQNLKCIDRNGFSVIEWGGTSPAL